MASRQRKPRQSRQQLVNHLEKCLAITNAIEDLMMQHAVYLAGNDRSLLR